MLKRFIKFGQASTWKGIISLAVALGLFTLTDTQAEAVAAAIAAVYAALSVILPDKMGDDDAGPKNRGAS